MEQIFDLMGWKELVLAFIVLAESIVRLTPSEKDNSIVNKISTIVSYVLNFIIPNKSKSGGIFKLFSKKDGE